MLPVPDGAGLGIALNMYAVEKHTGQRFGPFVNGLRYHRHWSRSLLDLAPTGACMLVPV